MKRILMTTGIAVLAFATVVGAQGYAFNTNLTVGSTGADVVALQTWLIANGYGIPAITSGAAAHGYFGSQTKAAVQKYQAANGIPNTGFVGPLTRGALNAGGGVAGTPATCPAGYVCTPTTPVAVQCPAGYICTPIGGGSPVTGTPTSGITTPGAEGLITTKLASNPISDPTIKGVSNIPLYGVEVKAQGSDMIVDRVLLEIQLSVGSVGTSVSNPGTFIRKLYAYDGSTLLKSWDVSTATFEKDSSDRYYVIASGLNFLVPKDATKTLTFSADVVGVSSDQSSRILVIKGYAGNSQNVRAVDGAGLNSYTDMSGNSRTQTFTTSGTSALTVTTNSSLTPKASNNKVDTTDGLKSLTTQVFDVKSTTGDSVLKKICVAVNATSTTGLPSTLYLYEGGAQVSAVTAAVVDGGQACFTDLTISVAKDQTKQFTVKADFASTVNGQAASTSLASTGILFEKPDSTTASSTNSELASNDQYLWYAAPQWSLVSTNIVSTVGEANSASSSITGTISLKATSNGGSMTKPVIGDFDFGFASSTASTYTAFNNFIPLSGTSSSTVSISVDPTDATVGDGGVYTVVISGTLQSNSTSLATGPTSLRMVVNSIDSVVGGNTITNQTWGIDTFYTSSATIQKTTTI